MSQKKSGQKTAEINRQTQKMSKNAPKKRSKSLSLSPIDLKISHRIPETVCKLFRLRFWAASVTLGRDIDYNVKKSQKFCRKIAFLTNKKCLAGKTSVGICSYNVPTGPCAKFQPNRMDSLGDPGIQGAYLGVGKPKTQERARGPTHTRRIPYRMEIPAPRLTRSGNILVRVVEGHASACPRTVGVDARMGR